MNELTCAGCIHLTERQEKPFCTLYNVEIERILNCKQKETSVNDNKTT